MGAPSITVRREIMTPDSLSNPEAPAVCIARKKESQNEMEKAAARFSPATRLRNGKIKLP
jgi:hypothetical protein